MGEERETAAAAIPFVVGIITITYSLNWLYRHPTLMWSLTGISFAATVVGAAWLWKRNAARSVDHIYQPLRRARTVLGLQFLLTGWTVCLIGATPFVSADGPSQGFFPECSIRFKSLIDSIPYRDGMSNSLVKAFLAGDRTGLPWDVRTAFRAAGASHLLALSGMHLSVIYLVFSKVLSIVGNSPVASRTRSVIILLGSGFFTLMTGAAPSLVRAFLFILLRESASILRRRTDNINMFCMALMLQLAISPDEITSVGFQLSYLAVLGIFLLYSPLKKLWDIAAQRNAGEEAGADNEAVDGKGAAGEKAANGEKGGTARSRVAGSDVAGEAEEKSLLGGAMRKVWSICALSVSCQVFTAPAVLVYFGTFPRYFLLTNLLCLPLTNVLIAMSLAVISLQAVGICPGFMLAATDALVHALIFVLDTIAAM